MASEGLLLPISLLILNLQDIMNQLKKFSSSNVLSDSLGGKKINRLLSGIGDRLDKVAAKAKLAFTSLSDFSSVEKDISLIELGLNRIKSDISNLTFKDLKIPDDVQGLIEALQGRIRELNNSLLTFKGTQKEGLINNLSFMANLKVAEPSRAAKLLELGYDELYRAINTGMDRVNTTLALKAAAYNESLLAITLNSTGKAAMTLWGALGFLQEAFKAIPKDNSKKSEVQKLMSDIMNYDAKSNEFVSFLRGAIGLSKFLKTLLSLFEFTPEQMAEIRARIQELVRTLKITATDVLKRMGTDESFAKNVLFGSQADNIANMRQAYADLLAAVRKLENEYNTELGRAEAYKNVKSAFDGPNLAIIDKAKEVEQALLIPSAALLKYQDDLLKTVTSNPLLAASFGEAATSISQVTGAIDAGRARLAQMDETINRMQGVSNFVNRYLGAYAIVRKVSQAIRSALNNIKELDLSITNIAVVTNMSQEDLWGKIGEYTAMAQQYGVATKDVYTVSQLFYQQGLLTSLVMSLTTETLKMAKISGMGYEQAANAMTVAVRAFKIEMSEALQVTDTYSALAAKFAVSSAEIANAMEKTASSAANVGMSLLSTSAFMSVMILTTRESALNIGSALKSIISRYGEMKASPTTLLNVEGEKVAFNKVDTALKSIGISIKDASGQFRDFDDVIMELAKKWNSLDNNTQRYIATVMAGNRQQSRFIALVSNYDELNRAMNVASTAENASIVQVAKTMDSLESKANLLRNAFSQLYLDLHLEEGLKGAYDWLTRIVTTIGKLGMLKGVLPTLATVINAGIGAKSMIGMGVDAYKRRIREPQLQEVDANVSKAQSKINELVKLIETSRTIPVTAQVNTTELDAALAKTMMLELHATTTSIASMMKLSNGNLTSSEIYDKLLAGLAGKLFETPEQRAEFLKEKFNMTPENTGNYTAIGNALGRLAGAAESSATAVLQAGQGVATTALEVTNALLALATATETSTATKDNEATASERVTQTKITEANASSMATLADLAEATASEQAAQADLAEAAASLGAALTSNTLGMMAGGLSIAGMALLLALLSGSKVDEKVFNSLLPDVLASGNVASATKAKRWLASLGLPTDNATAKLLRELSLQARPSLLPALPLPTSEPVPLSSGEKNPWYSKFFDKNEQGKTTFSRAGINAIGIGSGIARIVAPIITAIGASIKDSSKDMVESSKLLTGVGNGLSGAATGALIGMMAGPWGALIGAIGGFALNGLGAVLDGLNYTLTERIATLRQEAKEALDESLKKLAKVIDMSSTLDNLRNLKNLMYNSSEDMKAYLDAVASAADSYPELVSSYDAAGNAIIDLTAAEATLSNARLAGALAARTAALKELETSDKEIELLNKLRNDNYSNYSLLGDYLTFRKGGYNRDNLPEDNAEAGRYYRHAFISDVNYGDKLPQSVPLALDKLNKWIKTNSETIGYDDIYKLANVSNDKKFVNWTNEEMTRAYDTLTSVMNLADKKNNLLRKSADLAISLEQFIKNVDNDTRISSELTSLLETSKNYLGFFTNALLKRNIGYDDLKQWQDAEGSDFESVSAEVYSLFLAWYNNLSSGLKESFKNLDLTEYKNAQEIISKFEITDGLSEGFVELFILANLANRDRILKTIYTFDENGNWISYDLNEDLKGLELLGNGKAAKDIAYRFAEFKNKPATIISKYADYFTDLLVSIDKLALDGYTVLAENRLNVLKNLSDTLGGIQDSKVLNDLFSTITAVDLSSYKSITDAYTAVEQYGKNNNKTAEVQPVLNGLKNAENSLIYNVNTLAQELTSIITNSAKDIDTILSTNKTGLTFDKAIEAFNTLSASFDDVKNFDDIFSYDAVMGKYVYNENGLLKATKLREKYLSNNVELLDKTAKIYTDNLGAINKESLKTDLEALGQENIFENGKSLYQAFEDINLVNGDTSVEVQNAFLKLAYGYIASVDDIKDRTTDGLINYLLLKVKEAGEEAEAALVLLTQYLGNKKNLLYGAIDWGKLALGTDYTGTNKTLMESLAKELNIRRVRLRGQMKWEIDGQFFDELSPETVIQTYLNKTYKDDEVAKKAAEAAIKGLIAKSKSDLISTAITEVLNGTGQILSDTTIALIQSRSDLTITDGIITAGNDFVLTALDLYKTYSSTLLSLADKNSTYSAILEKQFELPTLAITALSSAASMDLSTLTDTFTKFDLELAKYYNNGSWQLGLESVMRTDAFGKTTISDWDQFLQLTNINLSDEILSSPEYLNAYSSYVDGMITLNTQMNDLIKLNYDNAFSSITEWKPVNVALLSLNETLVNKLTKNNAAIIDGGRLIVQDAVEYARNASLLFMALSSADTGWLYENTGWTKADIAKNWKNAQIVITEVLDTWTGLAENITSLNTDNISTLVEHGGFNLNDLTKTLEVEGKDAALFTKIGDVYALRLDEYRRYLVEAIAGEGADETKLTSDLLNKVNEAYNKAELAIVNKINGLDWSKILDNTATAAELDTFVQGLLTSLASLGIAISAYYNTDGTLNLSSLMGALQDLGTEASEAILKNIHTNIAETKDGVLSAIETAMSHSMSGTKNLADVEKFILSYNKLNPTDTIDISSFSYDTNLKLFTLNGNVLKDYIEAQKKVLEQLGMSGEAVNAYIKDLTTTLLLQEMDITSIFDDSNKGALTAAISSLSSMVQNYLDFGNTVYGKLEFDNILQLIKKYGVLLSQATTTDEKLKYGQLIKELYQSLLSLSSEEIINRLYKGGEEAVYILKQLKGDELTSEEVSAVYNANINRIKSAQEALESGAGTILTGLAADIALVSDGIKKTTLPDGSVVITAVHDMIDAYANIYLQLSSSAEATTADLNSTFAKLLTAKDQSNMDAISALSDAMGMSYENLGNLIAQYGKGAWSSLEFMMSHLLSAGIESLGNGQIRIIDWKKFSGTMNWEVGGEAYMEAYNAYNDSLIELDRKVGKLIYEEISSIKDAKTGDRINVTYLVEALEGGEAAVNAALFGMGATVKDGILTIENGAQLGNIIGTLANLAKSSGNLITSELAELADAVSAFIDNIVNLIKNGISGSLSNADASSLSEWAKTYAGIENLDFTKTAEGLLLSELSAIALYDALKKVDSMKAQLVFNELSDSLKANNDNFSSVTAIMKHIKNISEGIYSADGKTSKARLLQYEAELEVAKEILAVRSTQEDESFNFMSNKIPAALNNPLNYAKNWTLALQAFRDAFDLSKVKKNGKSGFMDYEDWYNIVTEMNNIATKEAPIILSDAIKLDGTLEAASKAILAGASALTTVDTGELKVNLTDVGIGIKSGADALTSGVTEGIQGVAKALMKALDGLIAMLELIVAMEQLGDIDTEGNGIDLNDLFTFKIKGDPSSTITEIDSDYKLWADGILKCIDENNKQFYNEDLAKAVKGMKIGEFSLEQILNWDVNDWNIKGADKSFRTAYAAILNALTEAAKSGNYDLDNIQLSVLQVLAESGLNDTITLEIGDVTYVVSANTITTIDWADTDTKSILAKLSENYNKDLKKAREELTKWIEAYGKGELHDETELKYVLLVKKKIIMEDDGSTTIYVGDHRYNSNINNEATMTAAMNAAILKDFGYDVTDLNVQNAIDGGTTTVTVKTKIGNVEVDVESDNGQVRLIGPHGKYKNLAEFLDKEWEYVARDHGWVDERGENARHYESKEEWQWGEYRIPTKITPKFTYEVEGETRETDPTLNSELRSIITELVTGGRKSIEELINDAVDNGDGTYTVNLPGGFKFNFTGGEDPVSALEQAFGSLLGIDVALSNTISTAIANAFSANGSTISASLGTAIALALTASGIPLDNLTITPGAVSIDGTSIELTQTIDTATGEVTKLIVKAQTVESDRTISAVEIIGELDGKPINVVINKDAAKKDVAEIDTAIKDLSPETVTVKIPAPDTDPITTAIRDLGTPEVRVSIVPILSDLLRKLFGGNVEATGNVGNGSQATGTLGLAKARGTLMGELGPELVVSKGRYFVAGLNGPEMVNLADDAIVFNHLQTKSLLEKGMSSGRGRAVTNELKAVSFAKGNVNGGPAMASASAALAALKQLRAQWASLAQLSAKDLAGKGGGGGGGGGNKAFIKELEKWYNWLLKIALLEKDINYYEQERKTITSHFAPNGYDYYNSLKKSITALKEELAITKDLYESLKEYFNTRRAEMNSKNNPFTALYTFDENGQLLYKDGALDKLSAISGRDNEGKPNMTPEEQYKAIIAMNPDFANFMKYDSSGNEIKSGDYAAMVQAFWDKIDSDKEEMLSLHDSIEEYETKMLELEALLLEALKELRDNLMNLELKIYETIVDIRLRAIDELQDTRDAIEDSNSKFIEGLTNALTKELDLYKELENLRDLDKLRAQLAILQRSGGSLAEITSLQEEIADKLQEMYFEEQQKEIDAILEASDKQLEKLDALILLDTELLEYLKKHGLLWSQVYEEMLKSPEEIANFIFKNNSAYWDKSPVASMDSMNLLLFSSLEWVGYRDGVLPDLDSIVEYLNGEKDKDTKEQTPGDTTTEEPPKVETPEGGGDNDDKEPDPWGWKSSTWVSDGANGHHRHIVYNNGKTADKPIEPHVIKNKHCTICSYVEPVKKKEGSEPVLMGNGGLIETPTQALIGETKKPEAVFNPEQTKILRKNILSNKPGSLINLLQSYNSAYKGLSSKTYSSISNNNSNTTSIGKAEINMNIDKLANSYDAKLAGRDVMNEILHIASKTSANNSLGR